MQQQQQQEWGHKDSFNLMFVLANASATCLTVFTRHSFGVEALGLNGLLALGMILAVAGFGNSPAMLIFLICWLCALVCQRVKTMKLVRQGAKWHSRYQGWPWVGVIFTRNERAARCTVEPLLCLAVGFALRCLADAYHQSLTLPDFIMLGALSISLREGIQAAVRRKRIQAIEDARFEQEDLAAELRRRRG